jgi:hypothetical protein
MTVNRHFVRFFSKVVTLVPGPFCIVCVRLLRRLPAVHLPRQRVGRVQPEPGDHPTKSYKYCKQIFVITNIAHCTFYIFVTFIQQSLVGEVFVITLSQFFEEYL